MADNTKIEWADATANFWIGCTKLSPACDHCYAERDWDHRKHRVTWGPHGDRSPVKAGADVMRKMQRRAAAFKSEHGRPPRVFINSLSDFADNHRSIDPAWREAVWQAARDCPDVVLMILTKRPQNLPYYLPSDWGQGYLNVWIGTTVENQVEADRRIPDLLATPAVVRFLSCEPLLGPVDLTRWLQVPSKIDEHFLCLGSLDDEERHNSGQDSLGVADTGYFPDRNGFPPMPLNSVGAPADVTTPIGAQPVHDFGGCAVDRESGAICPSRPTPPVEIPLPVEQSSEVGQCGNIGGNRHCLVAEDGTSAPSDPLPGNFPLDARPARPQSRPDGGDGFAGAVSFGNGGFPSGIVSCHKVQPTTLHWVIVGGESGPGARPMHPGWARSLRDQCQAAGVAFHFKQWGEFAPGEIAGDYLDPEKAAKGMRLFDGRWDECWSEVDGHCDDEPDVYRIGKKRAGRLLDGREWNEVPA